MPSIKSQKRPYFPELPAAEFPTINNPRQLEGTLWNHPDEVKMFRGFHPTTHDFTRTSLHQEGAERTILKFMLALSRSIPMSRFHEHHEFSGGIVSNERLRRHLEQACSQESFFRFRAEISADSLGKTIFDPENQKNSITLFPALFSASHADDHKLTHPLHVKNPDAFIFAMHLTPEENYRISRKIKGRLNEHVTNAFAHIRFHEVCGCFVISEIQSDFYRHLEPDDRKTYRDWAKVILLTFEHMILDLALRTTGRDLVKTELSPFRTRIFIPTRDLMQKLWPSGNQDPNNPLSDEISGLSSPLAHFLYEKLPQSLGYKKSPWPNTITFPETSAQEERVRGDLIWSKRILSPRDELKLKRSWIFTVCGDDQNSAKHLAANRKLDQIPASSLLGQSYSVISRELELMNSVFLKWYRDEFPQMQYRYCERIGAVTASRIGPKIIDGRKVVDKIIDGFVTWAPCRKIDPEAISGNKLPMIDIHRELLTQYPYRDVAKRLCKDFIPLSLGEVGSPKNDWSKEPVRKSGDLIQFLHLPTQNRNFSLRFPVTGENTGTGTVICLSHKGGGLYEKDFLIRGGDKAKIHHPPFLAGRLTMKSSRTLILPSHSLWGGLSMREGESEFLNTLALQEFAKELKIDQTALPVPLDLSLPTSIPYWQGTKVEEWLDTVSADARFLIRADIRWSTLPVVYRSFSRSDVRLSLIVNEIIGAGALPIEQVLPKIHAVLGYLYQVHGEEFSPPKFGLIVSDNEVTPESIAQYLRIAYEANKKAAERIIHNFNSRTLPVIASVHGAGGHLGGIWYGNGGAVSGGAPSIRNIDAYGTIHDLDSDIFLPWVNGNSSSLEAKMANREVVMPNQWADLFMWRDTAYWLETILRGIPLGSDLKYTKYSEVLPFVTVCRFGKLEPAATTAIDATRNPAKTLWNNGKSAVAALVPGGKLRETYFEFARKGASFVK